jgi:hypothetical protein
MVDDHVIHVVHVFLLVESRSKSNIVPRFTNLNEIPIDEPNTTLELKHMLGKKLTTPFDSTIEPHYQSLH